MVAVVARRHTLFSLVFWVVNAAFLAAVVPRFLDVYDRARREDPVCTGEPYVAHGPVDPAEQCTFQAVVQGNVQLTTLLVLLVLAAATFVACFPWSMSLMARPETDTSPLIHTPS